mgnify:FL=1|jgi:hypothetical protein
MIYLISFFIVLVIIYTNIMFYRKCDYDLDVHTFKKINLKDIKEVYKLRQPVKFNYQLNTINVDNLDTIFQGKKVTLFNKKTKKIEKVEWKKNKKNYMYLVATFLSKRNKEFNPIMSTNSYENYIVLNKDCSTIPKFSNVYTELITPVNGNCVIRIVNNEEKNYYDKIKSNNEDDIYLKADLFKSKMNYKDVVLQKGQCILIPSKWIYSIKSDDNIIIFNQTWNTYLNKLAHCYEYFNYYY